MKIGFTGTSKGMTSKQKQGVLVELRKLYKLTTEAHHGDCVGADEQFNGILESFFPDIKRIAHPGFSAKNPTDTSKRAFCKVDEEKEPKQHFARNRDIVDAIDILIAAPLSLAQQPFGGTWYTVEYAMKAGTFMVIVYPDGSVDDSRLP